MAVENPLRRRWFWGACTLSSAATLGLLALVLAPTGTALADSARFSLICTLAVVMAVGAMLALFSVKRG